MMTAEEKSALKAAIVRALAERVEGAKARREELLTECLRVDRKAYDVQCMLARDHAQMLVDRQALVDIQKKVSENFLQDLRDLAEVAEGVAESLNANDPNAEQIALLRDIAERFGAAPAR